jgi:hypothetical protein
MKLIAWSPGVYSGTSWTPIHPPRPNHSTGTGPYSDGNDEQGSVLFGNWVPILTGALLDASEEAAAGATLVEEGVGVGIGAAVVVGSGIGLGFWKNWAAENSLDELVEDGAGGGGMTVGMDSPTRMNFPFARPACTSA